MLHLIPQLAISASDLAAAFLFMYGLQRMSSPVTAPSGILFAGIGMVVAVLVSFFYVFDVNAAAHSRLPVNIGLAIVALVLGGGAAWWSGRKVPMTSMPQMVALYNGMGGGAAAAIAAVELFGAPGGASQLVVTLVGALIGSISLSGSLIAWAKLDGVLDKPLRIKGQQVINGVAMLLTLCVGGYIVAVGQGLATPLVATPTLIYVFFACAMVFGILMTLPIGGADMPVVISIYNAFTGLAVSLEGFVLQNPALMIAGMMVGAAGMLLTLLMAKAMNRSVSNVLFTNFGQTPKRKHGQIVEGTLKPVDAGDAGIFMRYASKVIIVPGYGLAVAQGQQKLYEFVKLLQAAGVEVRFAVHPVAGRMPGQMDVLLAEAGVPYDLIFQLDDINGDFESTDVALVIGANDVVNPSARSDKASPIFGMPILNADKAKQVYVVKRGEGQGYAGIENTLFYSSNCGMVYGDAQAVLVKMIEAVRALGLAAAA